MGPILRCAVHSPASCRLRSLRHLRLCYLRILPTKHHLCPLDERRQTFVVWRQNLCLGQRSKCSGRLARLQRGGALAAVLGGEHALAHQLLGSEPWWL